MCLSDHTSTIKLVNELQYLLTSEEIAALGEVLSFSVELVDRVVPKVAVKFDTGGQVHHQVGQGGDLSQYVFVLLQHLCHVGFERKERHSLARKCNLELMNK